MKVRVRLGAGLSRLAVAKKDFATAKQKLEPITEAALKEKIINPSNAPAYSQAFLVSGQVKEAEGNLPGALEDYLRTVTLFYHDRTAVASAQDAPNGTIWDRLNQPGGPTGRARVPADRRRRAG